MTKKTKRNEKYRLFKVLNYIKEQRKENNKITNNELISDDTLKFRVACRNDGNTSHIVVLIILDENNTEVHNSTSNIKPGDKLDLYNQNLSYKGYTTKVIVDNNWTNSTKQVPFFSSWVTLA